MNVQNEDFTFSTEELLFLFGLIGPFVVIGIPNVYLGLLAEEIEERENCAYESLASRDLVKLIGGREVAIDEDVVNIIQNVGAPHHSVVITDHYPDGEYQEIIYHYGPSTLIRHTKESVDLHRFSFLPMAEIVAQEVRGILQIDDLPSSSGSSFNIRKSVLENARMILSQNQAVDMNAFMQSNGLKDVDTATAIIDILTRIQTEYQSVTVLRNRDKPALHSHSGFALISTGQGCWFLETLSEEDDPIIKFIAASRDAVLGKLHLTLPVN